GARRLPGAVRLLAEPGRRAALRAGHPPAPRRPLLRPGARGAGGAAPLPRRAEADLLGRARLRLRRPLPRRVAAPPPRRGGAHLPRRRALDSGGRRGRGALTGPRLPAASPALTRLLP